MFDWSYDVVLGVTETLSNRFYNSKVGLFDQLCKKSFYIHAFLYYIQVVEQGKASRKFETHNLFHQYLFRYNNVTEEPLQSILFFIVFR